jgi:hypothetical protein
MKDGWIGSKQSEGKLVHQMGMVKGSTPEVNGGVVGNPEEARYQFGTGEHLLTKLRMKDGGMRGTNRGKDRCGRWERG